MSTQLSQTSASTIASLSLTTTGDGSGIICLCRLKEDDWSWVRTNASEVVAGSEHQQYDIGGASHTANQPVTLEFAGVTDVLWAALKAMRDTAGAFYAATLHLAATDTSGNERTLTFTRLRWLDLTHDSMPDDTNRFAARIYRRVVATLFSEA